MSEKNLDFDTIVDRRNTKSLKYDFAKIRGMPEDILPLWVADMDFKTSSYIQDALIKQAEHGIFGYSEVKEEYFNIVSDWMKRRHDWEVDEKWLIKTPGVVFALAMAVKAFTEPDDCVLIQLPVYYPFMEVIQDNGRRCISNTLVYGDDNKYHIDFDDFEEKIISEKIKLFFLCSPHNPVGRVWTENELIRLGDICKKHGVIVVSDEIHADFVFKGRHHVFSKVKKEFEDFSIICTSPSKTFNIAGLQLSNVFIANRKLKHMFIKQLDGAGYSQLGIMGLVACEAAYKNGNEWYNAVHTYIRDNINFTREYVEKNIPGVKMVEHEGTYLVWLNFKGLGIKDEEINDLIVNKAGLWLDGGGIFGESGRCFQRINVACPRSLLREALSRIERAVKM